MLQIQHWINRNKEGSVCDSDPYSTSRTDHLDNLKKEFLQQVTTAGLRALILLTAERASAAKDLASGK